ncbi:MAG TPA: hypothetical protein PKZ76_00060 [Xanthomonadaceae bacterium]|nr:hypothetical protein [Xanthomonadaceae bacterium]
MPEHRRAIAGVLPVLVPLLLLAACTDRRKPETAPLPRPAEPQVEAAVQTVPEPAAAPVSPCPAKPEWFPVTPFPDGEDFPNSSNCDFHQWSYQAFLWLLQPSSAEAGAPLNFETFADPGAVLKPGGPGTVPYPGRSPSTGAKVLARVGKSSNSVDADDVFQAGPGNRVLVDQAGNVVYYSGLLNEPFWDFVVDESLFDLKSLLDIAPGTDFPVNAIELKVSWRVAATLVGGAPVKVFIPDAEAHFHTMPATVPLVEVVDGMVTDNTGKTQDVLLAMVGMHVVGVVKDHPEFIWATFEHKANAPDCDAVPTGGSEPSTGLPWSLYTPNSTLAIQNQFDVNAPLNVVSVCRLAPWGGGNAQNTANIEALNRSVAPHLAGSVWANYELIGAVWTTGDGDIPGANGAPMREGDQQIGSLGLANTSMETFTQDANCFACHNGGVHTVTVSAPGRAPSGQIVAAKHLNLSHFIVNYQAAQQAAQAAE